MLDESKIIPFPQKPKQERGKEQRGGEELKDYFGKKFLELIEQGNNRTREGLIKSGIASPESIAEEGINKEININVLLGALRRLDEIPGMPEETSARIKSLADHIDMEKSLFEHSLARLEHSPSGEEHEIASMHQMHGKGALTGLINELEMIFPSELIEKFKP
jgi:hypothetical protein